MARTRIGIADLARLLDAAGQPVYVLDEERRIVFSNQACLDWTSVTAEELQAARCAYHSGTEAIGAEAVAAGLCPPPQTLAGQEMSAVVGCCTADGRLRRRRARFIPLAGDGESHVGVLAIVEPKDLAEGEADSPAGVPESVRWHERIRAFRRETASRCRMDRLVGDSPAIRRARAQVELAAACRASVLLVGPPGSGRQHLAAAIHYGCDPETAGPLIPLACAVLGPDLIQSTLAAMAAQGPPRAGRGTILLNEVDLLPPEIQADLSRLLCRSFPLRVIATAPQPLAELARRGEYREDLAAVLSTIVIELPPLRERRADLPMLLQSFLEEENARGGKQVAGFSSDALDALDAYPWPGNLDELIGVVRAACERAEGPQIGLRDLPQVIHLAASAAAHPRRPEETIVLDEFLARIERELLCRALARAKGNKTKAAKLLGMTRPRLYRRLVQLGLERP